MGKSNSKDFVKLAPKGEIDGSKLKYTWNRFENKKFELQLYENEKLYLDKITSSLNKYSFSPKPSTKYDFKVRLISDGYEDHWEIADTVCTKPSEVVGLCCKQQNGFTLEWRKEEMGYTSYTIKILKKEKDGKEIFDEVIDSTDAKYTYHHEGLCPGEKYHYEIFARSFSKYQSTIKQGFFTYTGHLYVLYFFLVNGNKVIILYNVDGVRLDELEQRIREWENVGFNLIDKQKRCAKLQHGKDYRSKMDCHDGPSSLKFTPPHHLVSYDDISLRHALEKKFTLSGATKEGKYLIEHVLKPSVSNSPESMHERATFEWEHEHQTPEFEIGVKILLLEKKGNMVVLVGKESWHSDEMIKSYTDKDYVLANNAPKQALLNIRGECVLSLSNDNVQVSPADGHRFQCSMLKKFDFFSRDFECTPKDSLTLEKCRLVFTLEQCGEPVCSHPFSIDFSEKKISSKKNQYRQNAENRRNQWMPTPALRIQRQTQERYNGDESGFVSDSSHMSWGEFHENETNVFGQHTKQEDCLTKKLNGKNEVLIVAMLLKKAEEVVVLHSKQNSIHKASKCYLEKGFEKIFSKPISAELDFDRVLSVALSINDVPFPCRQLIDKDFLASSFKCLPKAKGTLEYKLEQEGSEPYTFQVGFDGHPLKGTDPIGDRSFCDSDKNMSKFYNAGSSCSSVDISETY